MEKIEKTYDVKSGGTLNVLSQFGAAAASALGQFRALFQAGLQGAASKAWIVAVEQMSEPLEALSG